MISPSIHHAKVAAAATRTAPRITSATTALQHHDRREARRGGDPAARTLPAHRSRRQVAEQAIELPVRPRAQRGVQALLELVGVEPPLDGGLSQPLRHRVAVGVRCPE